MFTLASGLANSPLGLILIYAVIIGVFWWFLMRPQKKEQKRLAQLLSELEVGDTVLTTSGFYGVIIDITDDDVIVEFGSNKNCRIPMQKSAIVQVEKPDAEYEQKEWSVLCLKQRTLHFFVFLNHEGLKAIEKYDNIKDKTDITVDIGMKGRII